MPFLTDQFENKNRTLKKLSSMSWASLIMWVVVLSFAVGVLVVLLVVELAIEEVAPVENVQPTPLNVDRPQ